MSDKLIVYVAHGMTNRKYSIKDYKSVKKILRKFCPKRHNTLIVGRTKQNRCIECHREDHRVYMRKRYVKKMKKKVCKYGHNVFTISRDKYGSCKMCSSIRAEKWKKDNRERHNENVRNWNRRHPGKVAQSEIKNRTNRKLRVPKYGQESIIEFYDNCPVNCVVDHIVPLQNKNISGLHVKWNLQYLTPRENSKKKNKFDRTLSNTTWRN